MTKGLIAFAAVSVLSLAFSSTRALAAPPASPDVLFNYLKQNLPKDGDYDGTDSGGAACTVVIERLDINIKVDIMGSPDWGGFGILGDGSQTVDQFDQNATSVKIEIETSAEVGGLGATSYGVLDINTLVANQFKFAVGQMKDMQKKHPHMDDCTVTIK